MRKRYSMDPRYEQRVNSGVGAFVDEIGRLPIYFDTWMALLADRVGLAGFPEVTMTTIAVAPPGHTHAIAIA